MPFLDSSPSETVLFKTLGSFVTQQEIIQKESHSDVLKAEQNIHMHKCFKTSKPFSTPHYKTVSFCSV